MKLTTRVVVPTVVAGAIAVGAAAIAWADSTSPSPAPSSSASKSSGAPANRAGHRAGIARRALHGEFTVPQRGQRRAQSGTVQTMVVDTQRGQITAIDKNAKTVTVKSLDGFTRTYVVTSDTKIRSKGEQESFSDLTVGERAMVLAEKQGTKYVAHAIRCVHEPQGQTQNG
jgi:hypothetical protein